MLCLHNAERARHGLPRLSENPRLRRAAARHAAHMVEARFFDHTTPAGSTMVDRIRRTGYTSGARGWSIGENIAWGTGRLATAAQIHRSWMSSPGHRANILQRSFREIGIGIETGVPVRLSAAAVGRHLHRGLRRPPVARVTSGRRGGLLASAALVADVQPLHALHYALDRVGGLQPVVAPPYDVIDPEQRAALAARSPYNAVEIDLPQPDGDLDMYAHAAHLLADWQAEEILVRDPEPALWALAQDYTGPDGGSLHAPRLLRARPRRGLRPRPHPPPRAHPPGAEGGPPAAHARHAGQPLPHLLALRRPRRRRVGRAVTPHRSACPGARRPTRTAPSTGCGGCPSRTPSPRSPRRCATPSC